MDVAKVGDVGEGDIAGTQPSFPPPVMTEEQLEVLRRQIAVYATICHQLVELHKASTQEQPYLHSGIAMDSHSRHKVSSRHRWTPSHSQLQILESLFWKGGGTPNKQRLKEITAELSKHGPIQETNVYNWFQNRKARARRKKQNPLSTDSDGETDEDDQQKKKIREDKDVEEPADA